MGDISNYRVQNLFQAHRDLAETITAFVSSNPNVSWPFVTLPMFEVHAVHTRTQSLAEAVAFIPFVSDEQKNQWIQYSQLNQWHIKESQNITLRKDTTLRSEYYVDEPILPIFFAVDDQGRGFPAPKAERYGPAWQISPPPAVPAQSQMYDFLSSPRLSRYFQGLFRTQGMLLIGGITLIPLGMHLLVTDSVLFCLFDRHCGGRLTGYFFYGGTRVHRRSSPTISRFARDQRR